MGKREKERERKGGLGMPKEKGGEGENVRDKIWMVYVDLTKRTTRQKLVLISIFVTSHSGFRRISCLLAEILFRPPEIDYQRYD